MNIRAKKKRKFEFLFRLFSGTGLLIFVSQKDPHIIGVSKEKCYLCKK